jgi:hypothetical protein
MNLWVKSLRQLAVLAVASFFFSCEDEASLIGFKDPKPKFNVRYVDIPLTSSVVLADSFITDHKPFINTYLNAEGNYLSTVFRTFNTTTLAGEFMDPVLGNTRAEAFLQYTPSSVDRLDATSVYDSITMEVRFNYYTYGVFSDQQMTFNVHEVTEYMDGALNTRFFSTTPPPQIDPTPLGELKVSLKYADISKQADLTQDKQDTLTAVAKLRDDFGMRLFSLAYDYPDSIFAKTAKFIAEMKGVSIQPTQQNGILGMYSYSSFTRIHLHYHYIKDGVSTKAVRSFGFLGPQTDNLFEPNYTSITVDRGSSEIAGAVPYQSFQTPSGLRIVQSGAPVITKLDLTNFYAFADTVENVVINTAELVISDIQSSEGLAPISGLILKPMKGDQFINHAIDADSLAMIDYIRAGAVFPDTKHYYISREDPNGSASMSVLGYAADQKKYSVFVTFLTQTLFNKKLKNGVVNPDRIKALGLVAAPPAIFSTVNRTLFNAGNVKLRIYYTKPNQSQP